MQQIPTAAERFATLEHKEPIDEYNLEHFRTKHYVLDVQGTLKARGIKPGELAPDWDLSDAMGGSLRLSALRGTPVLLHFGSIT